MNKKLFLVFITLFSILAVVLAGCAAAPVTSSSTAPAATTSAATTSTPTQPVSSTSKAPSATAIQPTSLQPGTVQPGTSSAQATGSIEVRVTDAPAKPIITNVVVTVKSVEIHQAGLSETDEKGWQALALSGTSTFDLTQIKGLEQVLAVGSLPVGNYTQIRMEVTNVAVTFKDDPKPQTAKLPSGKLKFVQPFEVAAGKSTVLLFDFDAAQSINVTGNNQVIFKPVIKLNVTKTPGKMEIVTPVLPNGEVGAAYSGTINAIGGTTPYTWSIASGTLPTGLTLNTATGAITGTPTADGDFTFTAKVEDSSTVKKSATQSYTVNIVKAGVLQIITTGLPDSSVKADYTATLQAVGGTGAMTWSITTGSLPAGLTLNATTGVISGSPTAKGDFSFTVKVTDSAATPAVDTQNLSIHVAAQIADDVPA